MVGKRPRAVAVDGEPFERLTAWIGVLVARVAYRSAAGERGRPPH
jgi:hypothetical protein